MWVGTLSYFATLLRHKTTKRLPTPVLDITPRLWNVLRKQLVKSWEESIERVYPKVTGFRFEVDENCALLGYYTVSSGNYLLKFRDNFAVPSSRVKNPSWILEP